jgi:HAD superfamily hydrolase (TIGR01509 family)
VPRPAVLFDLDGTLVVFPEPWIREARREFIDWLRSEFSRDLELWNGIDELSIPQIIELVAGGNAERYRLLRGVVERIYSEKELGAAEHAAPRSSVPDLLEELRRRGISMAVTTNNSRTAANLSLKRAGIDEYFSCVVSRNDVDRMKPDPEMLVKASYALGAPFSMAIHVGDSPVDILAARSVGMMAVSLTGGVSSREKLLAHRPHLLIDSPIELLSLFP